MRRVIKVFLILISSVFAGETYDFSTFTELVSNDLGKNIYLDKDIKDYKVEVNLVNHQKRGQLYEFYKILLFDRNMILQYNRQGDFYFVKNKEKAPIEAKEPIPIHPKVKLHYYTYKIKNITNEDVANALSIFPHVKYKYLKQSDIIAYSATRSDHIQVKRILLMSDNAVKSKKIKLTLFAVNKTNLKEFGSQVSQFNFNFNSSVGNILNSLQRGSTDSYNLNTSANFNFTLTALQGWNLIKIYQQPTILLTNGMKAKIDSVINVPYLRTTSTIDSTTNQTIEQYEYKDIGLQIKINPKVKDNFVHLELDLVSEELISLDDDKPITQKIAYKSTITVKKGKPILLTGIKKTSMHYEKSGVPFLADLPYIGELFKYQSKKNEERNINILIEVL